MAVQAMDIPPGSADRSNLELGNAKYFQQKIVTVTKGKKREGTKGI
jgi:hypothetical protein